MEEAKALADSRAGRDDTPLLDQQAEGRWTNSNGDTPPSSRANTAAQRDVAHSAASRGIGHESSEHLQQDDDEFDQYRKRMMLAYRFRPNPLVRRSNRKRLVQTYLASTGLTSPHFVDCCDRTIRDDHTLKPQDVKTGGRGDAGFSVALVAVDAVLRLSSMTPVLNAAGSLAMMLRLTK